MSLKLARRRFRKIGVPYVRQFTISVTLNNDEITGQRPCLRIAAVARCDKHNNCAERIMLIIKRLGLRRVSFYCQAYYCMSSSFISISLLMHNDLSLVQRLLCSECHGGSTGLQVSSAGYNADPLVCRCPSKSLRSDVECSVESMLQGTCKDIACSSDCSLASRVASFDQSQCVPCSVEEDRKQHYGSPIFDANSNECKCRNPPKLLPTGEHVITQRLVELYDEDSGLPLHFVCLRCPKGTAAITKDLFDDGSFFSTAGAVFTADPTTCASCPDPRMFFDTDYSCKCADGFLITGEAAVGPQSCIERYPSVASGYSKVVFSDPVRTGAAANGDTRGFTLESITFSHYYLKAASSCEFFRWASGESLQSCQVLGNLCVMNMYDEDSAACKQLLAISQRRLITYHSQEEWKQTLPWLYYANEANDVINDRGLTMKMDFNSEDNFSTAISFKLAKYKLDGSFVGMEDVSNQFEYCTDSNNGGDLEWTMFGKGYRVEYSCDIEKLLNIEMFFYDMYVVDNGPEACKRDPIDSVCLYPVPVLNRNFVEKGGFPNMNQNVLDEVNDRYTRRFFLFDNKVSIFWFCTHFSLP
jgi:meckelin